MMRAIDLGGRLPLQPPAGLKPDARLLYDDLAQVSLGQASPFTSRTMPAS